MARVMVTTCLPELSGLVASAATLTSVSDVFGAAGLTPAASRTASRAIPAASRRGARLRDIIGSSWGDEHLGPGRRRILRSYYRRCGACRQEESCNGAARTTEVTQLAGPAPPTGRAPPAPLPRPVGGAGFAEMLDGLGGRQ